MNFLTTIRTKEDLEYFAADIDTVRENIYKTDGAFEVPAIIKAEYDSASDKNVFLEQLKEQILSAKILELTTAIYLDDELVTKLSKWVKTNLGDNVVLDLKIDHSILAGALITFAGRYKDYSFKDVFEKVILSI